MPLLLSVVMVKNTIIGCLTLIVVLSVSAAQAQVGTRPPELNAQFHRAETAYRSGSSVLEAKARVSFS